MLLDYQINDVAPYINWDYFFYAWGMHNKPEAEKEKLRAEAGETLMELQGHYHTHALFQLFEANSDGDDIVVGELRIPLLRQQQPEAESLCLADFIRPLSSGKTDRIGVFATSVDMGLETDFDHDTFQKMMAQLLADRLAEATAERMHEEVIPGHSSCCGLSFVARHQSELRHRRIDRIEAGGYPTHGEWCYEASC